MNFVLTSGLPELPFGSSYANVLYQFGQPTSEQLLPDIATHPGSRRVLTYDGYDLTLAPAIGLLAISVDAKSLPIEILGITINSLSPKEFADLLPTNGCDATITEADGFGDHNVQSLDNGIIASYCESQLVSFELHNPQWYFTAKPTT